MKKPKIEYTVYRLGAYVGRTFAVSEKQAINNIRHRLEGDYFYGSNYDYTAKAVKPSSRHKIEEANK